MFQLIIYAIVAIATITVFGIAGKNKSKWGINLKRVYCPVCHTKQPIIRWPDSWAQGVWGGTTCPKCHAILDKYGDVISQPNS
jgi:RNase P subunit RPR2